MQTDKCCHPNREHWGRRTWLAAFLTLCGPALGAWAQDSSPSAGPNNLSDDVRALLQRTSDVLAEAKTLTVDVETLREVRLEDGQIASLASDTALAMQRPNGLRADIRGEATLSDIIFDGSRVVVHAVPQQAYAEEPVSGGIDQVLPILQDKLGLPIDVGDLLTMNPFSHLTADTVGEVVAAVDIGGVPTWHMVLRSGNVPWEFWVRQDGTALPVMASVVRDGLRTLYKFDEWRLDPKIDPSLFRFTPPPGVIRVPFVFRKETP